MADQSQLQMIASSVPNWNRWREQHADVDIELRGADFRRRRLHDIDLSDADLRGALFDHADLTQARLEHAKLDGCDLGNSRLYQTIATDCSFSCTSFRYAYLVRADFTGSVFHECDFTGANLSGARLYGCKFENCIMVGTQLCAIFGQNRFNDVDLSKANDLYVSHHESPSYLDVATLRRSQGQLPEGFLKGCGFSDVEICIAKLWNPYLPQDELITLTYEIAELRSHQPIQIHPVFLSYSHSDSEFVDKLAEHLDRKGIRCWRDVRNLTSGRLESQIDRAIRLNPTFILILSSSSTQSDWVQWEVTRARSLQRELKRDVLCPIALDDTWLTCEWPGPLRQQIMNFNVLDFNKWQDPGAFKEKFDSLTAGLSLYYSARR